MRSRYGRRRPARRVSTRRSYGRRRISRRSYGRGRRGSRLLKIGYRM